MSSDDAETLLARHASALPPYVRAHAGRRLLRIEGVDDLTQGVCERVLARGAGCAFENDAAFLAWLRRVARSYLADRREHWSARKRRPARLLRLTASDAETADPGAAREPVRRATGPSTFASRREELTLALEALALLLPRDRDLVTWYAEGLDADLVSARLGIGRDAAERARRRALERFRKAYDLIAGRGGGA